MCHPTFVFVSLVPAIWDPFSEEPASLFNPGWVTSESHLQACLSVKESLNMQSLIHLLHNSLQIGRRRHHGYSADTFSDQIKKEKNADCNLAAGEAAIYKLLQSPSLLQFTPSRPILLLQQNPQKIHPQCGLWVPHMQVQLHLGKLL